MKYLCLAYQDERALESLSARDYEALVAETLAWREELRRAGYELASNALEPALSATSLRVRDGRVTITDGPFVETKEQLGGYVLIEARDLNEAIRVAASFPPARLGGIEVRPVRTHVLRDEPAGEREGAPVS